MKNSTKLIALCALLAVGSAQAGNFNRDAKVTAAAEQCERLYESQLKPLKAKRMDNIADDLRKDHRNEAKAFDRAVRAHKNRSSSLNTLRACNAFTW